MTNNVYANEADALERSRPANPMTQDEKWDALWSAACGVMAAYATYRGPHAPRPQAGLFRELDRLVEECARLKRVVDQISPDDTEPAR